MASGTTAGSIHLDNPRMVDRKSLLIAGLMKTYTSETTNQIPQLWQELSQHFGKLPGQLDRKAYGVVYNLKNTTGFAYLAGVEVSNASDVPDEFNVVRLPEMVYAVFPHAGHVSTLKDTISAIWTEWLPASGMRSSHADDEMPDMLEQYGETFDPAAGTGDIEVWVPIKSRARMITVEPNPGAPA